MKKVVAAMLGAAIVMQTSSARADLNFFKTEGRKTPPFLPTVSIAIGVDPGKNADVYGNFWLGVSHYPLGQEWAPFYSVGAELDLRTTRDDAGHTATVPVFGPQARAGISFFPDKNGYLSFFNAYGLFSYRVPSAFEGHTFRFGVGVSSPGMGLGLLLARLPLPWMLEGTCDVTDSGLRPSVRLGISY